VFVAFVSAAKHHAAAGGTGGVTRVGAGPGAPELLPLRAVRALQSADLLLIDDPPPPEMLDFARREAKTVLVGKTGPSCRENEVAALMIALAKAGARVVRLKGGGSPIFGCAAEEIAACRGARLAVQAVPRAARGRRRGRWGAIARTTWPGPRLFLERLFALAANGRQRDQHAQRERCDQQAEADRPLEENRRVAARNAHGAPEILLHQRPEHEAKDHRRCL